MISELVLMCTVWAYVFSVSVSFGEAFRKRNIHANMTFIKQKKIFKVYPVKCTPKCFITITT